MDTAMDFELTMRLLFGDSAYHIAGSEANPASRRNWLQKAVKSLLRHIDDLDTTDRHKKMLMTELEAVSRLLKRAKEPSWAIIYRMFRFSIRLIGFDYVRGARCHTPSYWQTVEQRHTAHILEGGDVMQHCYDRNDAISIRRAVVENLTTQGLTNFKIALVLNTTEYQIKKLRSETALNQ